MTGPDFDKLRQEVETRKSFASWKLDLIDALTVDKRLQASDVRVAIVILQHMNSDSRLAFPSQERIAALSAMKEGNVVKCLNRLKAAGWIEWGRGNRQKSNRYEFNTSGLNAMLDYRTSVKHGFRERRLTAATAKVRTDLTSTRVKVANHTAVKVVTPTTVGSNTSIEHQKGTPEEPISMTDHQSDPSIIDDCSESEAFPKFSEEVARFLIENCPWMFE